MKLNKLRQLIDENGFEVVGESEEYVVIQIDDCKIQFFQSGRKCGAWIKHKRDMPYDYHYAGPKTQRDMFEMICAFKDAGYFKGNGWSLKQALNQ